MLARVAGAALSAFLEAQHRAHGVEILVGAAVEAIEGGSGAARGVRLADGRRIACDAVLVGIGAVPNEELAAGGRARLRRRHRRGPGGAHSRPGHPRHRRLHPAAAAAVWPDGRLESVPNAIEQAKQAAADICGRPPPAPEVPWFWSDQYDLRLQMAGLAFDAARGGRAGRPDGGSFAVFHLDADHRVLAVEAVNAPADFMAGRHPGGEAEQVAPAMLRDPAQPLKDLVA